MKNLLILLIPVFLGCGNILNIETNVTVLANLQESRSLEDLGKVSGIELWISDMGVDYKIANPNVTQYYEGLDQSQIDKIDIDSAVVRKLISNTDSIVFDISRGVTKIFTIRVTYDTGRIFIGSSKRTINDYTTEIELDIYETAASIQNTWFSDLDKFIKEDFN